MRILVPLKGGLGNQLFQYSYAKNLQLEFNSEIYFDTKSYFVTDYRYRRKYMLEDLIPSEQVLDKGSSALLFLYQKVGRRFNLEQFGCSRETEKAFRFQAEAISASSRNVILDGYWQSPRYFAENNDHICREIADRALVWHFNTELCKEINDQDSIGLGMRFYSESSNPDFHSYKGIKKSIEDWQIALNRMIEVVPNSRFYIFTVDTSDLISNLNFHGRPYHFVDQKEITDGFPRLAVYASCRHHLFNNSTFFWWGAYLRRFCLPSNDQYVEISDNFLNQDVYPFEWTKF